MRQKEKIIEELRKRGCRITRQRRMILEVILEEKSFCCKEIYYKALKKDSNIGTATVYRMINMLEEMGVVERSSTYRIAGEKEATEKETADKKERGNRWKSIPINKGLCPHDLNYHEIIECITCALDAKDAYTAGHSKRVSDMSMKVCSLMGMPKETVEQIHIAAHLHDIGKIGVPDAVLNKTGRLDDAEWKMIQKHPAIGAEILSKSHHLSVLTDIVLSHHERFDGGGYPRGLKGAEIPVGARIIAICDSIDAMTSGRSYRKAHDFSFCYREIEKNLGKMYDPVIGRYVLEHWSEIIALVKKESVHDGEDGKNS